MNKVKTDLRNLVSPNHLDVCLRVGEEEVAVDAYNPDPSIKLWHSNQVCCLNSGPQVSSKPVKTGLNCGINVDKEGPY